MLHDYSLYEDSLSLVLHIGLYLKKLFHTPRAGLNIRLPTQVHKSAPYGVHSPINNEISRLLVLSEIIVSTESLAPFDGNVVQDYSGSDDIPHYVYRHEATRVAQNVPLCLENAKLPLYVFLNGLLNA